MLLEPEAAGKVIGEEEPRPRKKRWAAIAAVAVLLAVPGGLLWNFHIRPDVEPASVERMAFPSPDKPSIAVLPFVNMRDDPNQEFFCDGITEEIITGLSKVPELFVIARGNRREKIFHNEKDYQLDLNFLSEYKDRYGFSLFDYNLMPNHVHLLIAEGEVTLLRIMQNLQFRYIRNFNRKLKIILYS